MMPLTHAVGFWSLANTVGGEFLFETLAEAMAVQRQWAAARRRIRPWNPVHLIEFSTGAGQTVVLDASAYTMCAVANLDITVRQRVVQSEHYDKMSRAASQREPVGIKTS